MTLPYKALLEAYGTPLLVLDFNALDKTIEEFLEACNPHDIGISYAGKALLLVGLAKYLARTPLGLDVCSLGELLTAERAGFPASRITLHGCGKTGEELDAALDRRVATIVVDNIEELQRLAARERSNGVDVLLRVNTAIEAHTHEFVRTSGEGSKFGFDPDALTRATEIVKSTSHLRFVGVHSHIGSQIYDAAAFAANARALMTFAARLASNGLETRVLVAGGGFGIPMDPRRADETIDLRSVAGSIARTVRDEAARLNVPVPGVGIEPGRALIGPCGTTLYSVLSVKRQYGMPYAMVDGGIYENPRPALYDAYHHTRCVSRTGGSLVETIVCGRTCENDRLVVTALPADLREGDILAMSSTGAYTYSMASNYNRFPRPAVVAVRDGEHHLLAWRERAEDLLRNDVDA